MDNLRRIFEKSTALFRRRSLQYVISVTFTLIVVVGILVVTLLYSFQFSSFAEQTLSVNNMQVLDQVNLNMDNYLRTRAPSAW
ncbi:MAG TPA: hypothetical protein DEB31_00300 [Clostridiales bacterium]|nr:hypothetical protein [Clostridiales bacterium]